MTSYYIWSFAGSRLGFCSFELKGGVERAEAKIMSHPFILDAFLTVRSVHQSNAQHERRPKAHRPVSDSYLTLPAALPRPLRG